MKMPSDDAATHATPHLLDVVALLTDVPTHGLLRGQVGTVVEILDGAWEVEFSDEKGKTYAELALRAEELLILLTDAARSTTVATNRRCDPQ